MERFTEQKKKKIPAWSSMLFFACIFTIFLYALSSMTQSSVSRQKETLQKALQRDITYCYATEGRYPQSLDEIRERYGLVYDQDLFFVDYHITGTNVYPTVTVIDLGERHERY